MDSLVSGRERHASGRASHRGHGGHRGGLRLAAGSGRLLVDSLASGRENVHQVAARFAKERIGRLLDARRLFANHGKLSCIKTLQSKEGRKRDLVCLLSRRKIRADNKFIVSYEGTEKYGRSG